MNHSAAAASLVLLVVLTSGCSKSSDRSTAAGKASASVASPATVAASSKSAGESASTTTTAATVASSLAAKDMGAKLVKAGWTIESTDDDDVDGWPSRYLTLNKGGDEDYRSAKVWIDAFGEPLTGQPKPHVEVGKGALVRVAWQPAAPGNSGPDVAGFAKDLRAIAPPEKATDGLFKAQGYDKAVAKWGMTGAHSGSGGRARGDVIFNHRRPSAKEGAMAIEIVHFPKALETGAARLFGTTLVSVQASDASTTKAILAALGG